MSGGRIVIMKMFFFFNDTATTEIYTLSLHDALPIFINECKVLVDKLYEETKQVLNKNITLLHKISNKLLEKETLTRSEEHTSELQSRQYLVCRLLLEKKKNSSYHWSLVGLPTVISPS